MSRTRVSVSAMSLLWCLMGAGCFSAMSIPGGARTVFSQSFVCPPETVTVTPRPEIPPHTLLGHQADGSDAAPPPDVAADPARLQMWQAAAAQKAAVLDALAPVYEVNGCGKKAMLICYHPTRADIIAGSGPVVSDPNMTMTSGATVLSSVQCLSGQPANNGKLGVAVDDGLKVVEVRVGGDGARAGFAIGDVVVAVDQQKVATAAEAVKLLGIDNPAGHTVSVQRGGATVQLTLPGRSYVS